MCTCSLSSPSLPSFIYPISQEAPLNKHSKGGELFPDMFICALEDKWFWRILVLICSRLSPVDWKHMAALHNIDQEGKQHGEKRLHIIIRNDRSVDSPCGYSFEFWPASFAADPVLLCTCLKTNGVLVSVSFCQESAVYRSLTA